MQRDWFCFSLAAYYIRLKFSTFEEAVEDLKANFKDDVDYYQTADGDYRLTADCIHGWATIIDERYYQVPEEYEGN